MGESAQAGSGRFGNDSVQLNLDDVAKAVRFFFAPHGGLNFWLNGCWFLLVLIFHGQHLTKKVQATAIILDMKPNKP